MSGTHHTEKGLIMVLDIQVFDIKLRVTVMKSLKSV